MEEVLSGPSLEQALSPSGLPVPRRRGMREGEWVRPAADKAGKSGGVGQGANHPRGCGARVLELWVSMGFRWCLSPGCRCSLSWEPVKAHEGHLGQEAERGQSEGPAAKLRRPLKGWGAVRSI